MHTDCLLTDGGVLHGTPFMALQSFHGTPPFTEPPPSWHPPAKDSNNLWAERLTDTRKNITLPHSSIAVDK